MLNKFGELFSFSTFGESHGKAIGVIIDGVPAGLKIDEEFIQKELDRRKPGKKYTSKRKESDEVEFLSGIFEGISTGTPIGAIIHNQDQKSKDYNNIKDIFRPSHGDFTYFNKYKIRDYRGGGRSSARETASRVIAGGVAKLVLKEFGINIQSGLHSVSDIHSKNIDFNFAKESEIYSLDKNIEKRQIEEIEKARKNHDSLGGSVLIKASNMLKNLGEPMYYKLDGLIGEAMMGLNGVKAVEIGSGIQSSKMLGSENNDSIRKDGFVSNNSGGILAGISNGEDIDIIVHFKPTPSIFKQQLTTDIHNNELDFNLQGRHDPCIAIRGSIVCESMLAVILCDLLLINSTRTMENLISCYKKR
jgi:chorismate synthase